MPSLDIRFWNAAEFLAALLEHGSISEAARQFNETQSSLSKRLKRFEIDVGAPLVLRGGRCIALTEAGERLVEVLRHHQPVLAAADAAFRRAVVSGPARPTLRLGTGDSFTRSAAFRRIVRDLSCAPHPMTLELHTGNASSLEEMVLRRVLDVAIIYIPSYWPNLVYKKLFAEYVHFVTHAQNAEELRAGKLEPVDVVVERGVVIPTLQINRHRKYLDKIFGPHFETRIPIMAVTDGILPAYTLLSAGVGTGFLQAHLVGRRPNPSKWHCFESWRRQHTVHVVYEAELRSDPQMLEKIRRVEAAARSSLSDGDNAPLAARDAPEGRPA